MCCPTCGRSAAGRAGAAHGKRPRWARPLLAQAVAGRGAAGCFGSRVFAGNARGGRPPGLPAATPGFRPSRLRCLCMGGTAPALLPINQLCPGARPTPGDRAGNAASAARRRPLAAKRHIRRKGRWRCPRGSGLGRWLWWPWGRGGAGRPTMRRGDIMATTLKRPPRVVVHGVAAAPANSRCCEHRKHRVTSTVSPDDTSHPPFGFQDLRWRPPTTVCRWLASEFPVAWLRQHGEQPPGLTAPGVLAPKSYGRRAIQATAHSWVAEPVTARLRSSSGWRKRLRIGWAGPTAPSGSNRRPLEPTAASHAFPDYLHQAVRHAHPDLLAKYPVTPEFMAARADIAAHRALASPRRLLISPMRLCRSATRQCR